MKIIRRAKYVHAIFLMAISSLVCAEIRSYTVGVENFENILPYSQYANGEYSGLGKDILDLFAKKKGYTFIYKAYPVKRANALFFSGELDFRYPDNPYWVADQKAGVDIKYAPLLTFTDGVIVLPKNKNKGINNLKRLGIPTGFTPYKYLGLIEEGKIKLFEAYRYNELYHQVQYGKIDGAYVNVQVAKYYFSQIKKSSDSPVVFDPSLPNSTGFHHFSTIKYPKVVSELDAFMKDAANKAAIDELKRAYQFVDHDD